MAESNHVKLPDDQPSKPKAGLPGTPERSILVMYE